MQYSINLDISFPNCNDSHNNQRNETFVLFTSMLCLECNTRKVQMKVLSICVSSASLLTQNKGRDTPSRLISLQRPQPTAKNCVLFCAFNTHTHTHTHTHMLGFHVLWGLSIDVMVFILYKLYILSPYTAPIPKPNHHRRHSAILHFQKTSLSLIYKLVSSWGPKNVPTRTRILDIAILVGTFCPHNVGFTWTTRTHTHTHTHTHARTHTHTHTHTSSVYRWYAIRLLRIGLTQDMTAQDSKVKLYFILSIKTLFIYGSVYNLKTDSINSEIFPVWQKVKATVISKDNFSTEFDLFLYRALNPHRNRSTFSWFNLRFFKSVRVLWQTWFILLLQASYLYAMPQSLGTALDMTHDCSCNFSLC